MKKLILLFILFLFSSTHYLLGQTHYCRNYTINDGLPSNTINDILKDCRGFLWVGTNAGLARFDGRNFKIYNSLNGLAGDIVTSLAEGKNGTIWIASKNGGISKINGEKIETINEKSGLISNHVKKIYFSKTFDLLIVGTEDGVSVVSNSKTKSFHSKLRNVKGRLQITGFLELDDCIYVFTKSNNTFKYNPFLENLTPILSHHFLNKQKTSSAFICQHGDTLINSEITLLEIHNSTYTHSKEVGIITDYKEDTDGAIWISSGNNTYANTGGLFKYSNGKVEKFNTKLNLNTDNILALEYDSKENLLWIGTKEDGLYLYPKNNFTYINASDFGLIDLNISDLYADSKNNLWICTENSIIKKYPDDNYELFAYELFENAFKIFLNQEIKLKYNFLIDKDGSYDKYQNLILNKKYPFSNPYQEIENNKKNILPTKSLYKPLMYNILVNKKLQNLNCILGEKQDFIWIGSNVGVFKLDTKNNHIKFIDIDGNSFSKFAFDYNQEIIANSWSDLFIYPEIENYKGFKKYNYYDNKSPINVNKIKSLNDQLWFSSIDHGLFMRYNNKFYSTYDQNIISTNTFNDICFDNNGNVIAGGNNGITYILEFTNDSIKSKFEICSKNGIMGSSVRWLACTNENLLFIGTNSGYNTLNLEKLYQSGIAEIQTFNKDQGFEDYSGNTAIIDYMNRLWIGSNSQLIEKDLNNLKADNNFQIDFYFNSIEVNNEKIELNDLVEVDSWNNIPQKPFKLPYNKNSITFNYDVIHFLDPNQIYFNYKLEGVDNRWSNLNKDRKIAFQNLNPGSYRLRIKIYHKSETNAIQEFSINFIVQRPIWETWYFIAFGVLIVLAIIWLIIFMRTKAIKKRERIRAEISERITEFEMKALRSQMNPHFIFNAINSIQNYMLDNDVDAALNYLSDFAKLIRITLDNVSKKKIGLEDELNYLKYYLNLEQMRFDKKFETEIILPKELNSRQILIPPMIIQPYIENAIKHGFAFKESDAKIKLEFIITPNEFLKCIIEDNGIGRIKSRELNKNSKTSKSKGTYITNERLALLNQTQEKKGYKVNIIDLYDDYNLPTGTRVEIDIPL